MKVLHVVPCLPKASGVTTFVVECSDALQRLGMRQSIAINNRIRFDVAPSTAEVPRLDSAEALSCIRNFDIVHLHGIWPPFMHCFVVAARRYGIPVIWSLHGMLSPWAMKYKWWKKALPWALWQKRDLEFAQLLHVTGDCEMEWVRTLGFANPIVKIPLGTKVPKQIQPRAHKVETLLFVGRISPIKGLENLLRAWGGMRHEGWKLRIVGIDESGYLLKLKLLFSDLFQTGVIETPGPKYDEDLENEYQDAAALILPSFTENFGGVVVDALARGLPVITSTGTPWSEIHGKCGWWVGNDPDSLSRALEELMALPEGRRWEMGACGRNFAVSKYSWGAVAKGLMNAYESLTSK